MAMGHIETAPLAHYLNKIASQGNEAVNIGIGGFKDDWYLYQEPRTADSARKLIMRKRYDNPFLHVLLSKIPKKRHNRQVFDWDEQEYVPDSWTPSSTEASDYNKINVGTTNVKFFEEGEFLSINGIYTTIDNSGKTLYSTTKFGASADGSLVATVPETVKIVYRDLAAGTLTVQRGIGGGVASADSGSLVYTPPFIGTTHKLMYASNVFNEVSDGIGGFRRNPTRLYGALHLTKSKSWYSTEIEDNVDYNTSKPIMRQAEEMRTMWLKGIDRGFLHSYRLGGTARSNVTGTTSMEYQSTSLMENIPTTNFINYQGNILNMQDLNKALRQVFDVGSSVKYGFTTRAIVDELFWMNQQMVIFNERVSLSIGMPAYDYVTTTGQTLRLVVDSELEKFSLYTDSIMIVDMGEEKGQGSTNPDPYLQYYYLQNLDMQIHTVDPGKLPDTVTKKQYMKAVIGLKVAFDASHFFIHNIAKRAS